MPVPWLFGPSSPTDRPQGAMLPALAPPQVACNFLTGHCCPCPPLQKEGNLPARRCLKRVARKSPFCKGGFRRIYPHVNGIALGLAPVKSAPDGPDAILPALAILRKCFKLRNAICPIGASDHAGKTDPAPAKLPCRGLRSMSIPRRWRSAC